MAMKGRCAFRLLKQGFLFQTRKQPANCLSGVSAVIVKDAGHRSAFEFERVLGALATSTLATLVWWTQKTDTRTNATCESLTDHLIGLTEDEHRVVHVFSSCSKSVVFVENCIEGKSGRGLFVEESSGSGFVLDDKGHILTNCHVIDSASRIRVTTADHLTFDCTVVGKDVQRDIAVIKAESAFIDKLTPLPLGDSSALMVGQKALAIGNPFGLDHTLSTGVVSALDRTINISENQNHFAENMRHMIQTDAAMNPGSSGGPLLDSSGRVIGMNTIIYSESGTSAGVAFAIPINTIKLVAGQLIRLGHPVRPGLGVSLLGDQITKNLGIEGVIIESNLGLDSHFHETYRDTAGRLKLGDIIVKIDRTTIKCVNDIYRAFQDVQVGDTVTVEYDRFNGKKRGRQFEVERHVIKIKARDINDEIEKAKES
eukprot:m.216684 g.216684  ORF g.216684 m.216684 type:complete len:427 (+) comp33215_c6_seq9:300-1580(+)